MIKTRKLRKTNKTNKTNKKNKTNYCCPDKKYKTQCSKLNLEFKINSNSNSNSNDKKLKYAITTLLFGNDSYLPGIVLLGSSIRKVMKKSYENYITLCCMVTNDISKEARSIISKIYDRIIDVDYLQISPNFIKHNNPNTRNIYSKTFTKLRIFEMTEYDKILYLDADMLVLKKDIFSLFNLNTPASIFLGKLSNNPKDRYFKDFTENGNLFKQFQNKYCNWKGKGKDLHGNLIPYDNYDNEKTNDGLNIETSILLVKPSILITKQRDAYLQNIKQKHIKIRGDTEMVSKLFKDTIYAIEPRFFGRWVNPQEHPELVVLDLYGSNGKPWDNNKFNLFIGLNDVEYWWKMYMSVYKSDYESWNNKMLDTLHENIKYVTNNKKENKDDKDYTTDLKYIYIRNESGFGNKVFNIILCIYLYNLYKGKCSINYVLLKSKHETTNDPMINNIFPKSKLKINYITEKIYQNLNNNKNIKINKIYDDNPMMRDLSKFPKYEELHKYNYIKNNFRLAYEMYETFSNNDKSIFSDINTSLISQADKLQIKNLTKLDYVTIHIRYGDKFKYLIKDIDTPQFEDFLIYTPDYYIDMIKKYLKTNMKIIILTDSMDLVNKFILNDVTNNEFKKYKNYDNIILLDTHWITSFYILLYAKEIVMSCSTFSMSASYINEKAKCYIVLYHDDMNKNHMAEEYAIAPNWIISHDKNYVLNYNKNVLLSMID
jgi:hypothetical protein